MIAFHMLLSLAVSGLTAFLISSYFIIPHIMSSQNISNYEARDYKVRVKGMCLFVFILYVLVVVSTQTTYIYHHVHNAKPFCPRTQKK
jgi:cytochrome c biogenesis factor